MVLGAVLVAACSLIASLESVSDVETGLFRAVNALPSWLYGPLWLVMQLGSLGAVFAVAALAALWRRFRLAVELVAAGLLAYQSLDDEKPFRSAKRQIEVEALLDLLAARAGVRTPDVVALSELDDGTTLLAHQGLRASGLDTADADRLSDVVLRDLWTQVALLHRARLAHRDLRLANVMLDEDGRSWVVDFGFAEASAPDRALHRDVAELLASQSAKVAPIALWRRRYRPWAPVRWPGRCPTCARPGCDALKARPIGGSATSATARFKFATAAARISAIRTSGACFAPLDAAVCPVAAVMRNRPVQRPLRSLA